MRGQRALYDRFISKTEKKSNMSNSERRNITMIYRFFYFSEIKRLSFVHTIEKLENTFYLAEGSILKYLEKYAKLLEKLSKEKPSLLEIKKNMPELDFFVSSKHEVEYNRKRVQGRIKKT